MREIKTMGVTIGYVEEKFVKHFNRNGFIAYSAFSEKHEADSIWPVEDAARQQLLTLALRAGAFSSQQVYEMTLATCPF
jgi:hypothetical protein